MRRTSQGGGAPSRLGLLWRGIGFRTRRRLKVGVLTAVCVAGTLGISWRCTATMAGDSAVPTVSDGPAQF